MSLSKAIKKMCTTINQMLMIYAKHKKYIFKILLSIWGLKSPNSCFTLEGRFQIEVDMAKIRRLQVSANEKIMRVGGKLDFS
jgi:hypothetical protein